MLDSIEGEDGLLSVAVIGATGAIGGAFLDAFAASPRIGRLHALSRRKAAGLPGDWRHCDLDDEASIAAAASAIGAIDVLIVAAGVLHRGEAVQPEKDWRAIDPAAMAQLFSVNAIGPALAFKHFAPLLPRCRRSALAALSARVGSIGDNRLGGWYSYRASKAALNQIIRTFAIELARKRPQAIIAGLHPGTVETGLSAPFKGGPAQRLTPMQSVAGMLAVLDGLRAQDSGAVFDWKGLRVPE
jgi:NAD(P)-dependent dehydrogenase (short-subunit alcohol dehydrogenase family)